MSRNPAAIPTIPEDIQGDGRWMSVHRRFVSDAQEKEPEVVFIGDSIIAYLSYTEMWDKQFAPLHCINFGYGSERVENVLWRVSNGEMDQFNPKAVVLMVGTNNNGNTPPQISEGIEAIVDEIRSRQPNTYIIVLSLLPRGDKPNSIRDRNDQVNKILTKSLSEKFKTQLVNIDPGFVQPNGSISHHDMWDYLHLTTSGYNKAFEPVYDLLLQVLNDSEGIPPEVLE